MPQHLYRFRSTYALLDGHQELERQEILFSSPEQLNDPLEGFKNVRWRGDEIVWHNLLRHYLLCLLRAAVLLMALGSKFTPNDCKDMVLSTDADLPDAPVADLYTALCDEFFSNAGPNRVVFELGSRRLSVRRQGLAAYLRIVHPLALGALSKVFADHGLSFLTRRFEIGEFASSINENLGQILEAHAKVKDDAELLLNAADNVAAQIDLINDIRDAPSQESLGWLFIARDFPKYHAVALEKLTLSDWYSASFVQNSAHAAMWGIYGDSHRGICLQFRTERAPGSHRTIELEGVVGFGGGRGEVRHIYDYRRFAFEKVRYANDYPEIDFFESLGRLSRSALEGFWFAGKDGRRSPVGDRILAEDPKWREDYWAAHGLTSTTKLRHWAHERELRLLLSGSLIDRTDINSRKFKYRFSSLAGIIFGMKTTHADKLEIMRIVERKVINENRRDFVFSQAVYSTHRRRIEIQPLQLLKINDLRR